MDYDAIDECNFCVQEFWRPWFQELLDIEGEAKQEETAATFDVRDAISKSERDLALKRREVAAEAVITIRAAKIAVINAMDAIEAEKAKRYADDKEKYGIHLNTNRDDTNYQDLIAKAINAKKKQESRFETMKLWSEKWALRQEEIVKRSEEKSKTRKKEHPIKQTRDDSDNRDSVTSLQRRKGGMSKKNSKDISKEKLGSKLKINASKEQLGSKTKLHSSSKEKLGSKTKLTSPSREKLGSKTKLTGQSKEKLNTMEKKAPTGSSDKKTTENPPTSSSDKKTTENPPTSSPDKKTEKDKDKHDKK